MIKEPEIKLFGRKISLPENDAVVSGTDSSGESSEETDSVANCSMIPENSEGGNGVKGDRHFVEDQAVEEQNSGPEEESQSTNALSELDDNPKTPSTDDDVMSGNDPNKENMQTDATNGQQKALKKPDKILPCPRCKSMDTKFCYYNNYNVNQPRHFCRSCQRYWTAGGTMRNVPVGAGRRKNKNSVSHCRHMMLSEALHSARFDAPNGFHHVKCKPNGTVLSFGADSPLCESMSSALNLADKSIPNGFRHGYHKMNQGSKNEDISAGSTGRIPNLPVDGEKTMQPHPVIQSINGFPSPAPCISPWPFPWNSAVAFPAVFPPGYPLPYYPAPYWNCGLPNGWNVPWISMPSPTTNLNGTGSGPSSPLGKHSRNGELLKTNNSEGKEAVESRAAESSIVVPKTLRIDDPDEAAKSSIWTTLGIKYDSCSREGLFKALQPKGDEKKQTATNSPLLQANPAALSRSISFQERA